MLDVNQIPIKVGIRDGGDPDSADYELHLECRFPDGRKGAMITVDPAYPNLATLLSTFLNDLTMISTVIARNDL
jgi:hypothetical protein